MTHYIGMIAPAGGYLPSYCQAFETRADAVESLRNVMEEDLTDDEWDDLDKVDVTFTVSNEVIEIQKCECKTPAVHCDI